jgi:uncharacterized repeat protein (TIGR03803 family)
LAVLTALLIEAVKQQIAAQQQETVKDVPGQTVKWAPNREPNRSHFSLSKKAEFHERETSQEDGHAQTKQHHLPRRCGAGCCLSVGVECAARGSGPNRNGAYTFCSQAACADGYYPYGNLIMDKLGNLYSTTTAGGGNGYGNVYKLTANGSQTVLYSFNPSAGDGYDSLAGLVMDKKGNLYGTTFYGGANGRGTVFEVSATGNYTILHSFNYSDGQTPLGGFRRPDHGQEREPLWHDLLWWRIWLRHCLSGQRQRSGNGALRFQSASR